MIKVRSLNAQGLAALEGWLKSPASGAPKAILEDPAMTDEIDEEFLVDPTRVFSTSYELGVYLHQEVFISVKDPNALMAHHAMWSWISLTLIDSLLKKVGKDSGKPLATAHYVDTTRLGYRLISRTAWDLVRRHADAAKVALGSRKSPWGDMAEQMTSRQEIYSHKSFWSVAYSLYATDDGSVKKGSTSQRGKRAKREPKNKAGLGGVRRLPFTFKQFDRTYNLRQMNGEQIVSLLPPEYEKWRTP